jgi:hypothetical protein
MPTAPVGGEAQPTPHDGTLLEDPLSPYHVKQRCAAPTMRTGRLFHGATLSVRHEKVLTPPRRR